MATYKTIDNLDGFSIYFRGDSLLSNGTPSRPSLRFLEDSRTGIYRLTPGPGLGISVDTAPVVEFTNLRATFFKNVRVPDGDITSTGIGWSDADGFIRDDGLSEVSAVVSGAKRLKITPTLISSTEPLRVEDTTDSADPTQGSIQTAGGIGVIGNASLGSRLDVDGITVLNSNVYTTLGQPYTGPGTGDIQVGGGINVAESSYFGNGVEVAGLATLSETELISDSGDAFVIRRQTGLDKVVDVSCTTFPLVNIIAPLSIQEPGGNTVFTYTRFPNKIDSKVDFIVSDTSESFSPVSGAVVVSGGVGIAKRLNVGGAVEFDGAATLNSTLDVTGLATLQTLTVNGTATVLQESHRSIAAGPGATYDLDDPPARIHAFESAVASASFIFNMPAAASQSQLTVLYDIQNDVDFSFNAQAGESIVGRDFLGPTTGAETGVIQYVSDGISKWYYVALTH